MTAQKEEHPAERAERLISKVISHLEDKEKYYSAWRYMSTTPDGLRKARSLANRRMGRLVELFLFGQKITTNFARREICAQAWAILRLPPQRGISLASQRLAEILGDLARYHMPSALEFNIGFDESINEWVYIFAHQSPQVIADYVSSQQSWLVKNMSSGTDGFEFFYSIFQAAEKGPRRKSWPLSGAESREWWIKILLCFLSGPVFGTISVKAKFHHRNSWWDDLSQQDREALAERLDGLLMTNRFVEWLDNLGWNFTEAPRDVAEAMRLISWGENEARLLFRHLATSSNFYRLQEWDDDLARRVCTYCADQVAKLLQKDWSAVSDWRVSTFPSKDGRRRVDLGVPPQLLKGNQALLLTRLANPLGYRIGVGFFDRDLSEPTLESVVEEFSRNGVISPKILAQVVTPFAQLWFDLRKLAAYEEKSWERKNELAGLRPRISKFASENPDVWAQSLDWVLARVSSLGGLGEALTVELALREQGVLEALKHAASPDGDDAVRDRARGVLAIVDGAQSPRERVLPVLLDFVARYIDGRPVFPHPLSAISATWVGTTDVEQVLRDGIRRACDHFARDIHESGLRQEPALVAELIKELIVAFRDTDVAVRAFAKGTGSRVPSAIKVSERQLWQKEEKTAFCDIAFLLRARVRDNLTLDSVELVQAKVSKRRPLEPKTKAASDCWTLELEQVRGLGEYSQTAVYWLITGDGEVLVVPARLLLGIVVGMGKDNQKTATVHYHQIHSMVIPLWEFLVDLFIGVWLGTSSEKALAVAEGEESPNRPRHVVHVDITFGEHENVKERT